MTSSEPLWKTVFNSVRGTSHDDNGQPCQDFSKVVTCAIQDDEALIAVCADGAGSAEHSDKGSQIACEVFAELCQAYLAETNEIHSITEEIIEEWLQEIRDGILVKAVELDVEIRQLATTLLGCIVVSNETLFVQIGDGAMIYREEEDLEYAFWPHSGEYANMTNFLTSDDYLEKYEWKILSKGIDELASFTDGLERLMLRFEDKTVYSPALTPMLDAIRKSEAPEQFLSPLEKWLNSDAVNERTDDDKTLILAIRSNG